MTDETMLRAALLVALMSVAPFALAEESDALGTMHDLSGNTTVLLLEKGSDASRGCKALDGGNVEVERERADHCCQNEAYCCGGKACASGSSQCGFRFVFNKRGWGGKAMHGAHEEHKDKGDEQHKDDGKKGVKGDNGKKVGDDKEHNVKKIAGSVGGDRRRCALPLLEKARRNPGNRICAIFGAARAARGRQDAGVGRKASTSRRRDRDIVGFVPGGKAPAALSSTQAKPTQRTTSTSRNRALPPLPRPQWARPRLTSVVN
jgi:hypothetical protein